MAPLKRFGTSFLPVLLLGACAQLIGLGDYDSVPEDTGGKGGRAGSTAGGGTAGAAGAPDGGTGPGGQGGTTGGDSGEGGTSGAPAGGDGGVAMGGTSGQGGTGAGNAGVSGAGAGTGGSGAGGASGSGGQPPCTPITLDAAIDGAIDDADEPTLAYYTFDVSPQLGTPGIDEFEIEFWDDADFLDGAATGPFQVGTGTLDDTYESCSRCLVAYQDRGSALEKAYLATSGTLNVAPLSLQMQGSPNISLSNVTLREIELDTDTFVPGGSCLTLATGSFRWDCDIDLRFNLSCDCGCGSFDPTCVSSNSTSCGYCWCDASGLCAAGEVQTASNWVCN